MQFIPAPENHAIHVVRPLLRERLGLSDAHPWCVAADMIATGEGASARGTLKAWAQSHNGKRVDTFQVQPLREWRPGARTLKAGPTFATLDGSRTDYAGNRVIHATDDMIVFTYDWGGPAYVVWSLAE